MSSLQEKTEKLIVYGKSQLSSKGVESTATTIREVLDDVTNIQTGGGATGTGQYLIQVVDYDGTVLKSDHLNTGDTFTLPEAPTHDKLVFQGWSSPYDIVDNTVTVDNQDITIGPMYTTASGLSEFDITLTKVTGLTVTFNMVGNKDWGDGTSNSETTHTYTNYGNYTITCDGTATRYVMFGQSTGDSSSSANFSITNVRLSENITYIENNTFTNCRNLKNITIPYIPNIDFSNSVFVKCYSLTSITIPSSVTTLINTFQYCYSLTSITIPKSVTSIGNNAFQYCNSLTSINIPETVNIIGSNAFSGCYSLTNIIIPSSVTIIYNSAFYSCVSLTSITIPENVTSIKSSAIQTCYSLTNITMPSKITSIGGSAIANCHSITEYDFSTATSVPTLENTSAFNNINGICKIIVPDTLYDEWIAATNWTTYADYIYKVSEVYPPEPTPANYFTMSDSSITGFSTEGQALYDAGKLTELVLPSSYSLDESGNVVDGKDYAVTRIGGRAFDYCNKLTSVVVPIGVTSLGGEAFYECRNLSKITLPEGLTSVEYNSLGFTGLTSIIIPESLTNISNTAFAVCKSLNSIIVNENNTKYDSRNNCNAIIETGTNKLILGCLSTIIPEDIEIIGYNSFRGCLITNIIIPASVTSIEDIAFFACMNLTEITIPSSVTSIGNDVFVNSSLRKMTILATTPPTLSNTDAIRTGTTIYIPAGTLEAYQTATNWSNFADKFVEMENYITPGDDTGVHLNW